MVYKKRFDNRKMDELRPVSMKVGVLKNADGSAMFQIGRTIVLAAVYGPKPLFPQRLRDSYKGLLRVYYRMLPFSVPERKNPKPGRREIELSLVIKEALNGVVLLDDSAKAVVDVYVYVTQADAGTRCAGICAASLALADAGIPMKDLVTAVAAGIVDKSVLLDLEYHEENYEEGDIADIPIAYCENFNKIMLLQMDGKISQKNFMEAITLGIEGCKKIKSEMIKVLKKKYEVNME